MRGKTMMLQSLKSGSKSVNNSSSKSGQETKLYLCFCRKRKNGRPLIGNPWISSISTWLFFYLSRLLMLIGKWLSWSEVGLIYSHFPTQFCKSLQCSQELTALGSELTVGEIFGGEMTNSRRIIRSVWTIRDSQPESTPFYVFLSQTRRKTRPYNVVHVLLSF